MSVQVVNSQAMPVIPPKKTEPKTTTLDKAVNFVEENTKAGTFVGDNPLAVTAGALVGGVAGVSATVKLANKFPAVKEALKFVFVDNGALVGAGTTGAGAAILAEDAVASFKEGDTGKAAAEAAGATVLGLTSTELVGRKYNIPVMNRAISYPLEVAAKNARAIGGAALATGAVVLGKSGVEDLQEGKSMLGGAKLLGSAVGGLGGAELIGRQYDIPVVKKALSGPAEFVAENVKAVTGGVAIAGGAAAITKGVSDLKEGKKLQGGAEVAGGVVGVLGGGELIGRQYNIPILKEALTGPFKLLSSKAGIAVGGGVTALSGVVAAGDGVRRLTTKTGIANDAIGVAEVTAGVAGTTGGISLIGYATGSEKLMKVFPENITILGGTALISGAAAMGKYTVDNLKDDGLNLINAATGTGAALMALGGTEMIADKVGVPILDKAFTKGAEPVLAAGLGVAAYKLGEHAVDQGKDFMKDPNWVNGAAAAGLSAASVAAGATSLGLVGHAFNIPVLEQTSLKMLHGVQWMGNKTVETVGKVAEPVFKFAVNHPAITLGALAVTAGAGYYIHQKMKDQPTATEKK